MELKYNNKKNSKEILDSNNSYVDIDIEFGENLLFKGDNLQGLLLLLQNGYKGKIDLIYIDPPFNTNQTFSYTKNRISTISRSKKGKIAYDDNLDLDKFLEFLRQRLIVMKELLSESGSIYLHIDYKVGHYVKIIMDEIFGINSFKNDITRVKSNPKNFSRKAWGNQKDLILFYSKDPTNNIWNNVKETLSNDDLLKKYSKVDKDGRNYNTVPLHAPGESNGITGGTWKGMLPPEGRHWRTSPKELDELDKKGLIEWSKTNNPRLKKFADEHIGKKIQDIWTFKDPQNPKYPTEKNRELLKLIINQSSKIDSYVLDCFSGSGGTLIEAVKLKRKFIGMDMSDFAIEVSKKQLINFDFKFIEIKQKM